MGKAIIRVAFEDLAKGFTIPPEAKIIGVYSVNIAGWLELLIEHEGLPELPAGSAPILIKPYTEINYYWDFDNPVKTRKDTAISADKIRQNSVNAQSDKNHCFDCFFYYNELRGQKSCGQRGISHISDICPEFLTDRRCKFCVWYGRGKYWCGGMGDMCVCDRFQRKR